MGRVLFTLWKRSAVTHTFAREMPNFGYAQSNPSIVKFSSARLGPLDSHSERSANPQAARPINRHGWTKLYVCLLRDPTR